MKATVLSIDAWRNSNGGWDWNNWWEVNKIDFIEDETNRKLLARLRDAEILSEESKGKVAVEDDGYNIVIMEKSTHKPIFAIEYGPLYCYT